MNTLVCLGGILFLLMVLVGGKKGARSFIAIFLNFCVILFTIFMMTDPLANPVILALIACTVISCITLFYINEVNRKTVTAFLSTMITFTILILFIVVITDQAKIQGFGEEETEELTAFSLYLGVDFVKIAAAMMIMSTIGAITDVAISISSPMQEMKNHNPTINRKELFTFGLSIGRDILGTNTNTLFFAFFGGYLAMLIWFKDLSYSLGTIVNSKVFSGEMINILCAGIGVALIIPITSWITAFFLDKEKKKK
ncbi:YibE/F family protein [Robertmurraya korlensis]|uniref:YibE/F family protein n=1 Tax=Robertmurraya korlensis TaxID=519977 RepID=UPI0008250960|nr:YibE/F family protein [Robertmurraya korlensis]